jgi:hypothetical protein
MLLIPKINKYYPKAAYKTLFTPWDGIKDKKKILYIKVRSKVAKLVFGGYKPDFIDCI